MNLVRRDPDKGYLDQLFWVPKGQMNAEGTKRALTFVLEDTSVLSLWKETEHHILVPREFWSPAELPFEVIDCRPKSYESIDVTSRILLDHRPDEFGVLRPTGEDVQRKALQALLDARGGILQLGCGKGKTVIFLELVAQLRVPTLIAIDNTQLLEQWKGELERHLVLPGGVGLIKADVFDWHKPVVLTTYQTLSARADVIPDIVRRWFGLIAWDEGHHSGAHVFSRTLDIFPGKRVVLTATPDRNDGLNIVYKFHVGGVIYKDLKPEMIPRIYFLWTGFRLNMADPLVAAQVNDRRGDLHLKKMASYFGHCQDRLDFIMRHLQELRENDRHALIVSEAIDEVVNLLAAWNGHPQRYTDIPLPTSDEVALIDAQERLKAEEQLRETKRRLQLLDPTDDATKYETLEKRRLRLEERLRNPILHPSVAPLELGPKEEKKLQKMLVQFVMRLADPTLNVLKQQKLLEKRQEIEYRLLRHAMALAVETELARRQRAYIHALINQPSSAGLLIEEVDAKTRLRFVKEKKVVFSIAKYGREGLDNPDIDTVFVSEPFSSRNILQQLMGRPSRRRPNKKTPVFVVLEDDIGPCIGMCTKLRGHLREWPEDEGGPFKYELVGHPKEGRRRHG